MKTKTRSKTTREQIRLLPQTRAKLEAIAGVRRWKLNAAVDAVCDDFMAREGIKVPGGKLQSA